MFTKHARTKLKAALVSLLVLITSATTVVASASPAHADPACNNGGFYVLWARGSNEGVNDVHAHAFYWSVIGSTQSPGSLGPGAGWAELGNFDGNQQIESVKNEYPAVPFPEWFGLPLGFVTLAGYNASVQVGINELVTHLNDRYAGDGPEGKGACTTETLVLGGYSQGADVIGATLQDSRLSAIAKSRVGFVALFGDPKYYGGFRLANMACVIVPWGLSIFDDCKEQMIKGALLLPRIPYVSSEFNGRVISVCHTDDFICDVLNNDPATGFMAHTSVYRNGLIAQTVSSNLAPVAKWRRNQLNPGLTPLAGALPPSVWSEIPLVNPVPVAPSIHTVKRTVDSSGTNQVYAATKFAVTEAWWVSGGDGVHTKELIHIAQGNIVGMDKTNLPEGKQALYTAVSDGVWETWWDANNSPSSAKILTGLSGVRQVIVANRVEPAGYTHRLYILAEDGPYEAWWRDGGDGIHLTRLNHLVGGVTMAKSVGPDGADQLYVATPTWVYELHWGGNSPPGVHHGSIINISQADIISLSKGDILPSGGQLLYTGSSTTVWQSYWLGSAPSHGAVAGNQTGILKIQKTVTGSDHQIYFATPSAVKEYWWHDQAAGNSTLFARSQSDISTFYKYNAGSEQQVYTGTSAGEIYETWWGNGTSPTTKLLFVVGR